MGSFPLNKFERMGLIEVGSHPFGQEKTYILACGMSLSNESRGGDHDRLRLFCLPPARYDSIPYAISPQMLANLIYQLYPMCHNQHLTALIAYSIEIPLHELRKHNGLPRTGRHLHHHAAMRLECLIDSFANR